MSILGILRHAPSFREKELILLVGGGTTGKVKKGIQRLEALGLLEWSRNCISVDTAKAEIALQDSDEWLDILSLVKNNRRKIPVPRKMIRYLARSRSVSLHMTTWGHMLRCLYYRKDRCVSGGKTKLSWLVQVFHGDHRNIKKARKHLIDIGWLEPVESSQISLNRWGLQTLINLHWNIPGNESISPPLKKHNDANSPPLIDRKLSYSKRVINQKPQRATGVKTKTRVHFKPTLKHITLEDLRDPMLLDQLYWQAIEARSLPHSEFNRLLWFAAAEHSLSAGKQNPCGLFVSLYTKKLWHHITQEQEDYAKAKLKKLDFGEDSHLPGKMCSKLPIYDSLAA